MSPVLLSLLLLCAVYSARTQSYDYVYGSACQNTTNCQGVSYSYEFNSQTTTLTIPAYCMHTGPTGDGVCCIAPSGFGTSGLCSANSQCCSGQCVPAGSFHTCNCFGGGRVCDNNGLCCSGTCTNYACTCSPATSYCQADSECCSGLCQTSGPFAGTCACITQADCGSWYCLHADPAVATGTCFVTQGGGQLGTYNYCTKSYKCASGYCLPGRFLSRCACTGGGNICDNNALCCSGTCTNNVCACSPTSSPCQQNSECCSGNCQSGTCE